MIAIIPARGGSKGLPGKNIKDFCQKPLIAYTIEEAKKSKYIDEIIISTDDQEIAQIAKEYGATCPFMRPKELATDTVSVIDAYIYTIDKLKNEFGKKIERFIVLQPTSPLRLASDIDSAIELFKKKDADSVVGYTQEDHPIIWHKYINDDGSFENIFEENIQNRQEIRSSYYPNGAIFVFKYELIKSKRFYTDKSYAYIMPRNRSVDIDTLDDFEYAEFLMKKRIANG